MATAALRGANGILLILMTSGSVFAQPSLRERMLVAEDQRASSEADMAPLREGLRSRDAAIRRQAVRAIGRFERADLIPLISPLLTDTDPDVRAEAANAMGQLARGPGGLAAASTGLAARARAEQRPSVRGVVAATLGRLAYSSSAEVRHTEEILASMLPAASRAEATGLVDVDEVAGAVEGLEALVRQSGKLQPLRPHTIARLRVAAALHSLPRIRRLAWAALIAAGHVDRPLLNEGVSDPDDEVRRLTMIAARADIEGREAVLKKGLRDANARVRYEALQTWSRVLPVRSCAPVLDAVRDANQHVMLLAIDLLGGGCPADDLQVGAALQALAETITSSRGTWHAPAHALVSLARVLPAEARKLLPLYRSHAVWHVRMYGARAAGRLGAFDALDTLGRDPDDNVREAALAELVTLKRPEAIAVALEALTRRDYQLVLTASRALAPDRRSLGEGGAAAAKDRAIPALLAALERMTAETRDTSRDPRLAILTTLEALDVNVDALRPYLGDFDPAVANKAAEILQQRTQRPVAAEPQPRPHPSISLAQIEALASKRLRFVMSGKGAFELRLLIDEAPLSALRVATRAREGYYNGLTFHRVVPNFVIQGGSPDANEYAGDGPYMRDELGLVSHRRGTAGISTRGRDTGDAQIFVNLVDLPRLDHTYTVFAEVIAGMDVVDALVEGDVIERVEVVP